MRESGGSDRYGARYSAITERVTAVSTHPSSARATRRGHGTLTTRAAGTAARIACSYAPERIVPAVPITPILSLCGKEAARRTQGSTIPTTGILEIFRRTGRARDEAVL